MLLPPFDRRAFVFGAALAPACAGQRTAPSSATASVPRYQLDVSLGENPLRLLVRGSAQIPAHLAAQETLTIAIADRARAVRLWISAAGEESGAISLVRREDGVADLRRWRMELPPDHEHPDQLSFSLEFEHEAALLFGLRPEAVFASATGIAWYPQLVDGGDIRLLGVGELSYRLGDLVVVSSGARRGEPAAGPARFQVEAPDYFSFIAAPFLIPAPSRERSRVWALAQRSSDASHGAQMDRVLRALELEFGPLPRPRLDLVEAPTEAARAAGFDGASLDGFMLLIGAYFDQPFNTAFFAHEGAHQWWGGSVRRRGLSGAYLLDEALAQYGSLRAVEALEGPEMASVYRRTGYPGYYTEYGAFWYLARSLEGIDAPLIQLPQDDGFIARRVANTKGMLVWDMLARQLGHGRFSRFLSDFARDHAAQRVSLDEFMQGLRQSAGVDAWFIDQWFAQTGAPTFSLDWSQHAGRVAVTLTQTPPFYRARVPLSIRGRAGEVREVVLDIEGEAARAEHNIGYEVVAIELDPDYTILRWNDAMRARATALQPYTQGDIVLQRGDPAAAEAHFRAAFANADGELRFQLLRGLGEAALRSQRPHDAAPYYRQALEAAPARHEALPEVWRSLADALRALGDARGYGEAVAGQRAAILALPPHLPG